MNKTGSQIERENTHAKKRVIAAMEDLVIATIETRIIAKRIPVFMENRFARLNGSYHILKNTDARNHVVFASSECQGYEIYLYQKFLFDIESEQLKQ